MDKWSEVNRLYIDMIELLFKDGDVRKGSEFEDAIFNIREDCRRYGMTLSESETDLILTGDLKLIRLSKKDREYLEQFIDYAEKTTVKARSKKVNNLLKNLPLS